MSNGFDLDWLRLREAADRRARSRALARRFAEAVRAEAGGETAVVVDLGAGSGANFRALATLIDGNQDWRLIDRDPALLAQQPSEIARWGRAQGYRVAHGRGIVVVSRGGADWRASGVALDLAALDRLPITGVHGITCSALLDLVSRDWIEAFACLVAAARVPFLAALTTDGRRQWDPSHAADAIVGAAFARHQGGDKGFGPALGGEACGAVAEQFVWVGHRVAREPSDWDLGSGDEAMLELLIDGAFAAAAKADPASTPAIAEWRIARRDQNRAGALRLRVGHCDLLALPAGGAD